MARALDIFFDQNMRVTERGDGLALARCERVGEVGCVLDLAHPLAAAACDGLDEDGIADFGGAFAQEYGFLVLAQIARRHRHTRVGHQCLGRILQPHRGDAGGARADPDQPRIDHRLRERRILRQEAIARMDRLRPGAYRGSDDLFADQIALARRRRPDMHRLIRLPHMQRLGIGVRIDRDRADTHCPRGANDAAGDLASVGDEEGLDHCLRSTTPGASDFAPRIAFSDL